MPYNTKLAFRSFKKCPEENKLIKMEQFLKIPPKLHIYLFFYFIDLVIESTQIHDCVNVSHGILCDVHGTLKLSDNYNASH